MYEKLLDIAPAETARQWMNRAYASGQIDYTNPDDIQQWYNDMLKKHGPKLLGKKTCTKLQNLVFIDKPNVPSYGSFSCHDCRQEKMG